MATKKKSSKKATKKPAAKKAVKKAPKKAPKKATKKTAKKSAAKKTAKTAAKKSSRKATRRTSAESPFPTMVADDRQDDYYSSVGSSDPYSSMGSGTDTRQEEEGSSRGVAMMAIVAIAVVVIIFLLAKGYLFKGDKKEGKIDGGKKVEQIVKKDGDKKTDGQTDKKDLTPVKKYRTYVVKKGDTLGGIARKFKVRDWRSIVKLNKLKSARDAKPGTTLQIPDK